VYGKKSYSRSNKAQPVNIRTNGSNVQQNKASTTEKPQNFGNPTNFGADLVQNVSNWFFGTNQQKNQNQGNTYDNTPVEQTNQKYVTKGYSTPKDPAKEAALKAAMQKSAAKYPEAWAKAGVSKTNITRAIQGTNLEYRPFQTGQPKGNVITSAGANLSPASVNQQKTTNAQPEDTTFNPYVIGQNAAGITGGFQGNTQTTANPNVVPSAIQNPAFQNLSNLYSGGDQFGADQTSTINQTQNKYSTDLPMERQAFTEASQKVSWKVANHIHAAIPPTDDRWNMKQNLYQKAMQAADPLIEIQNNPQLKPKEQFMQQKGANITQLMNYDAFTGNIQGDNTMNAVKTSNFMPFFLLVAGAGVFLLLRRK